MLTTSKSCLMALFLALVLQTTCTATVSSHKGKSSSKTVSHKPVVKKQVVLPSSPATLAAGAIAAGDKLLADNDTDDAIAKYQDASSIAVNAHLDDLNAQALTKLGEAYLATKDTDQGIQAFTDAQTALAKVTPSDDLTTATVWTGISSEYLIHGDLQKVVDCATSGLPIYDKLLAAPTPADKSPIAKRAAKLAFNAGNAQMALQSYADAEASFNLALGYVGKAGQDGTLMNADTLAAIADARVAQKLWQDAAPLDDEAIAIYVKLNNINGQIAAQVDRSLCCRSLNIFDKAADSDSALVTLYQSTDNTVGEEGSALNLGADEVQIKHYDKAKDAYTTALNAATKIADPDGMAKANVGIGITLEETADYNGAIAAYDAALPQYEKEGNNENTGALMLNLGGAYAQESMENQALQAYNTASSLFAQAGDTKSADVATQQAKAALSALLPGN